MELLWQFFSYFGDIAYWLGFTISFFLIYPFIEKKERKKWNWILYYLLPSILLSYFSAFILKEIFKVPRICIGLDYCPKTYSFPSGHATIAFSLATFSFLYFRNYKIFLPILALAFLISYSRIALGVHTLTDIVGGAILGIAVSVFWYFFFKNVEKKKNSFALRKFLHSFGIFFILFYLYFGQKIFFAFSFVLTLGFLISEIFRLKNVYFPIVDEIKKACKYKNEKGFLFKPFYYFLSFTLLSLFPKNSFLAGAISLVIGDLFASLFGKNFGSYRAFNGKSLEGSIAFFIPSFLIFLFIFSPLKAFLLTLIGIIIEFLFDREENLVLPLSIALISYFL